MVQLVGRVVPVQRGAEALDPVARAVDLRARHHRAVGHAHARGQAGDEPPVTGHDHVRARGHILEGQGHALRAVGQRDAPEHVRDQPGLAIQRQRQIRLHRRQALDALQEVDGVTHDSPERMSLPAPAPAEQLGIALSEVASPPGLVIDISGPIPVGAALAIEPCRTP